ncbi:MAG TPA: FtsX-like permease family protein [Opitutaceae bacterium]|nr:FtsX-like permease family protein [Opitutaceae bacterium]
MKILLLIGCANVASLLLARASARQREFAVRAALGASRGRNVRQLLTECLMLFGAGGAAGALLARGSLGAVDLLGVARLPRGFEVSLDGRVLLFTFLTALGTAVAFGALPAWTAARADATDALRAAGGRATAGRRQLRLRSVLIVMQVALALMLLGAAGVLARSYQRVQGEQPGFARERTVSASLTLPAAKYDTPEKRAAFAERLLAELEAVPGVAAAGLTSALPFTGPNPRGGYQIVGREPPPGQPNPNGFLRQVSPGYFPAMGIALLRGRLPGPADTLAGDRVVVVDRVFAERHFPGADPVGQQVRRDETASTGVGTWTVVGVVAPVKHWELEESITRETIYFPYAQAPAGAVTVVVKAVPELGRAEALVAGVRAAVLAVDPEQPVFDVQSMEARIEASLETRRTPMVLIGLFAAMSAGLAALGLYGVLAFVVGQRTREFGVRMAPGAGRREILALVARQGARLVALGLCLGLAGYGAVGGLLRAQLFAVSPFDPGVLAMAAGTLAGAAALACGLPARRAAKVDPAVALRAE